MKILLVDDDEALATIFSTAIKKGGYEVIMAADGKSGIQKAHTEKPNFILLDQVLPDMQGNDILKVLKADPQTKSIPVALLSNFGQNELIQEALQNGAIDYILKYQISPDDLVRKIQELSKETKPETPVVNGPLPNQ